MGAWGPEPFENDEALDWMNGLIETQSNDAAAAIIQETFERLSENSSYIEVDEANSAVAAAAVIAAVKNPKRTSMPQELLDWIGKGRSFSHALEQAARDGLTKVLDASEPKELWSEAATEMFTKWQSSLRDIQSQLLS